MIDHRAWEKEGGRPSLFFLRTAADLQSHAAGCTVEAAATAAVATGEAIAAACGQPELSRQAKTDQRFRFGHKESLVEPHVRRCSRRRLHDPAVCRPHFWDPDCDRLGQCRFTSAEQSFSTEAEASGFERQPLK